MEVLRYVDCDRNIQVASVNKDVVYLKTVVTSEVIFHVIKK